jgi:outer membrane protein OmpA-like peptidoglycan-associated protein
MTRLRSLLTKAGLLTILPCIALAFVPQFDTPASVTASLSEPLASYALPLAPWDGAKVPVRVIEGQLAQTAWRLAAPDRTTLQLLSPLRDQLAREGYRILWECWTDTCGGFDFRYAIEVLPEPDMRVDLGDFRFLAAERAGPDGPQAVTLLVSRSAETGHVQLVTVGGEVPPAAESQDPAAPNPPPLPAPAPTAPINLAQMLEADGFVALDDLLFASGSARLDPGTFQSLTDLAAYLAANPARMVVLVGHTDASGALAGNTTLSRARAASVRDRLITEYGVDPAQISAEGVGYLSPRATNLTAEGRARNRRVEAVLSSTE